MEIKEGDSNPSWPRTVEVRCEVDRFGNYLFHNSSFHSDLTPLVFINWRGIAVHKLIFK